MKLDEALDDIASSVLFANSLGYLTNQGKEYLLHVIESIRKEEKEEDSPMNRRYDE